MSTRSARALMRAPGWQNPIAPPPKRFRAKCASRLALTVVVIALLTPAAAHAYVGPGAGFA